MHDGTAKSLHFQIPVLKQPITALNRYSSSIKLAVSRFFSRPSIEVHLQPVSDSSTVIPVAKIAGLTPIYELPSDLMKEERKRKSQSILVRVHGNMIRGCKARLKVGNLYTRYLYWTHPSGIDVSPDKKCDVGTITADLTPKEDFLLMLWYADKSKSETTFTLNVEPSFAVRIDTPNSTPRNLPVDLTFIFEDRQVNKKPYRFIIDLISWASLGVGYITF